ncbi:MAG: DNA primase [Candidatus Methanoperedenaceae archaeon]|nr:MAG: DNA primase [Candidatus Methanoperedenaceae archaeon]
MTPRDIEDIERLEQLENVIAKLKELALEGAIIVVEGRKDVESLRYLGINGQILLASQQPLLDLTESLARSGKKIVLLTDWDNKGYLIAKKLEKHLLVHGMIPDTRIRSKLRSLSKKSIKDIESLNNYVNKLRYEVHGLI